MRRTTLFCLLVSVVCLGLLVGRAQVPQPLPGSSSEPSPLPRTAPLTLQGDLSAQMVVGIGRFLDEQTLKAAAQREKRWHRDFSSKEAYEESVRPNRDHLRKIIGAVDSRLPVRWLEIESRSSDNSAAAAETEEFTIRVVRWPVPEGVFGDGLWLVPKGPTRARVIAVPDADQTPEQICGLAAGLLPERQFARRLAEHGCEVLVPVLINRDDAFCGNARLNRFTNQPHREWIYRQAYEMGRHIVGYEVQKVLAGFDFFENEAGSAAAGQAGIVKLGLAGYGEGALVAFYAAAVDPRVDAVLVSGCFEPRERLWQQPIYRNIFGLVSEFGDAEVATLIAARSLVIEHSPVPSINGPPAAREGRSGAAPGKLMTPDYVQVENEFDRARSLLKGKDPRFCGTWKLICGTEGMATGPMSDRALVAFLQGLEVARDQIKPNGREPAETRREFDPSRRQQTQVRELEAFTQRLLSQSESVRESFFWNQIKPASPQQWQEAMPQFREIFYEQTIGDFGAPTRPADPRSRKILEDAKWTGFEVVLDVHPNVFAWGYLLVPKDLQAGERRPVVVCQHGLEGVPEDVINNDPQSQAFRYYKAFAAQLAERGFVVFAPHNPYRGHDKFRELQRKANPLGKSLFSIITAQHARILEWLGGLPFVDARRIGFYGLSYGGKTAMRVPAVLEGYCLSICSGDFNDWVRKNVSVDNIISYMFTGEYEMPEWDLGETFNYAEMAGLIAPRPFMVERGHSDSVGLDEWVAYEFAKVRRLYDRLGIPHDTAIEFFNGPHTINGVDTFKFLHHHLNWPERE